MGERLINYIQALNEPLRSEMERDPTIIIMGEDVAGAAGRAEQGLVDAWGGPWAITKGLIKQFGPERVRDTPISEAGYIGAGVGAALTGLRPIVDIMFVDFTAVCFDPILNNASKIRYMFGGQAKVPMVITTKIGAGTGNAAQHSSMFYSIFSHIPGLKCVAPSDAYTAKGLMIAAIRDDDPVVFCDHRKLLSLKTHVPEEPYVWPIGKARILRQGRDVTFVCAAQMVNICQEAAAELAKEGIEAEIVDLLSLSPLDEETILESVAKTHRLVIVDEDSPRCSIATDIATLVSTKGFDSLDRPVQLVTAPHTPVPYSRVLEMEYIPTAAKVILAVKGSL